jgi:hypothetical protein
MVNSSRRAFLRRASCGLAALAPATDIMHANANGRSGRLAPEPWLERLTGRHKQFFDVGAINAGAPLGRVASFFEIYNRVYDVSDAQLNVVFGAHGSALGFVLTDNIWLTYRLGLHFSVVDPIARTPAMRNVFSGPERDGFGPSIKLLQQRGVRFIACMQSIARLARELALRDATNEQPLHEALLTGLLEGVVPVPAMIVAANRAQEVGLTYVFVA